MDQETFDFIVTGAGSAGCAVAGRLSEDGRYRVLLLEAGKRDSNPWIHVPIGFHKLYTHDTYNWRFESEPVAGLNGRTSYQPRGKMLGGTSSLNGMVYMRGTPADYDGWRQRGCVGWDYASVLPFFRKAEDQERGEDEFHGVGGPLRVSDQRFRNEIIDAVIEAAVQAGIPRNDDFNGATQEGVGYYQGTIGSGRRWSAATAYLKPARNRKNLVVATEAYATRLLIENRRTVSIEFRTPQGLQTARCRREIVVSGGVYGSPQLLMLSGLGPAQHLQDMGIAVLRDIPAVGSNLHDHFNSYVAWRCSKAITLNDLENSRLRKLAAGVRYALFRSGPMASNGIAGHIWNDFSSQSYKDLPSVGQITVTDPINGSDRKYTMPAGGRGYTRPPSLIRCAAACPGYRYSTSTAVIPCGCRWRRGSTGMLAMSAFLALRAHG